MMMMMTMIMMMIIIIIIIIISIIIIILVQVVQNFYHDKTCIYAAYLQPQINNILPHFAGIGSIHLKAQRWNGTD
jgi:hypothetical protein